MIPIDLMKVDAEGFDVLVLRGAKKLLSRTQLLIFECHQYQSEAFGGPGTSQYQAQLELSALGFEVYILHPHVLIRFDGPFYDFIYDAKKEWMNCFAMRPEYKYRNMILDNYDKIC